LIKTINGVLVEIQDKEVKILLNTSSDITTTFLILKFFLNNFKILNLYSILVDEFIEMYVNDNHFKIREFNLNDFLYYFNHKRCIENKTSGIDEDNKTISIKG
jgi:hypothetical protein